MKKLKYIFLIVIHLSYTSCISDGKQKEPNVPISPSKAETKENIHSDTKTTASASNIAREFSYKAPLPINGKLKAVIELGASGFNYFIVNIDEEKHWKLEKSKFGYSLVHEHMANSIEIREGLRKYISEILDFGKIEGKYIYFVASSGALKDSKVRTILGELRSLGYVVKTVTPEEEAKFGFDCLMPADYVDNSFIVDIGSSNTKLSYMLNGSKTGVEMYGSKYYQNGVSDETVFNDIKDKCSQIDKKYCKNCFIMGGVPFKMAEMLRKDEERYTILETKISFYNSLAAKEGEKVKCGLVIFEGINKSTNPERIVFDWDANFTIGYLKSLPY